MDTHLHNIHDVELDGLGGLLENGMHMMEFGPSSDPIRRKVHYVNAPVGLPGIKPGTKLRVLQVFTSDASCPIGPGKMCCRVEGGIVAAFAGAQGIAWFKERAPPPP